MRDNKSNRTLKYSINDGNILYKLQINNPITGN